MAIAFAFDLLIGDPRWFPHPVKLIARFASRLESLTRGFFRSARIAGVITALLVVGVTGLITYTLVRSASRVDPIVGDVVSMFIIYTGLACRDLMAHSLSVWAALRQGDIETARSRVAMICGRDTARLDEAGVVKATVESVAENLVDAVTAPLFFAVLAGPVGIMAYKAVSTLDSMFGYRDERYIEFGWASARLDDAAAFLPSRITGILVPVAAFFLGLRVRDALRVFLRDRLKHPSPNAGHTEAAAAGALGIQLGGLSHYGGLPSLKPTLGDALTPAAAGHIIDINRLLLVASILVLALFMGTHALCMLVWTKPA
ncbi:MAG: adenosylcobinamide-phosphate synthase CbiB [Pseudomonadota bacterium]